jgi:hypothetical protein
LNVTSRSKCLYCWLSSATGTFPSVIFIHLKSPRRSELFEFDIEIPYCHSQAREKLGIRGEKNDVELSW